MFRKSVYFCAFIVGLSVTGAMAAPTIRQLGTSSTTSSGTTIPQGRHARVVGMNTNGTRANGGLEATASVSAGANETSTRTPVANIMNSARFKGINGNKSGTTGTASTPSNAAPSSDPASEVTKEEFNAISERVEALETRADGALNDVVSGNGAYVTDISLDGTNIKVAKTDVLVAPVREGNSQDITGSAEIWIVK